MMDFSNCDKLFRSLFTYKSQALNWIGFVLARTDVKIKFLSSQFDLKSAKKTKISTVTKTDEKSSLVSKKRCFADK